jgi:integrase
MRAFILCAAFTLMRPGELYVLEWADIDFKAMRYTAGCDPPRTGTSARTKSGNRGTVVQGGARVSGMHP